MTFLIICIQIVCIQIIMADTSLSEKKIGLLIWQVSNYWQSQLRKILKNYNLTLNEYLIIESIQSLSKNKRIADNIACY